jgi:predicted alpha/beta-fold hydrolase
MAHGSSAAFSFTLDDVSNALRLLEVPPFHPPPFLASAHLQTIVVPTLPAGPGAVGERVRVPIAGGTLAGHLHRVPNAKGCVVVLHGIAGTANEPFVLRVARLANRRGLDALRLHLRGAGDSSHCGPAPLYHAGLTEDVRAALRFLLQRYPRAHAVGFSLGGQLVLRALGEWGQETPEGVGSITAISPPLDLAECSVYAEGPQAALYRRYIIGTLKKRYRAAQRAMGDRFDDSLTKGVRTLREYDAAVIAPYFGYRDVAHYYEQASSGAVVDRIVVPTLVLHAEDDPLVTVAPVARLRERAQESVRVVVTERGGHVGFLAARRSGRDETRFWAEQRAIDLAEATT